ncbi:redoxin domain-containing protein [Falsirhodobacter sp. alg1]|uniref:redoxin domain-containing protein n=1 Tax=Falsirhodobacter sp. alg1 TaxID=1472418 RepID=UPI0007885831|nr:redoxin domain-containing protein [Falsirhodobacter sp. alg1]
MTHQTPMPGSKAPAIHATAADGNAFTAPTAPEGGFSVVFFYRGVHCPKCKDQLQELAEQEAAFREANVVVSAVSMDDDERFSRQKQEWNVGDLTLGNKLTEESAREWGLFISAKAKDSEPAKFAEPGIAVIQPDGTIYALYIQNVPFARPGLGDLLGALKFIMANDYPVRGTA